LNKFGEGFAEGFGDEPLGLSDESLRWLSEQGIFHDPETGRFNLPQLVNEALLYPTARTLDLARRTPGALITGLATSVGQAAEESGRSHADAMSLVRDIYAAGITISTVLGAEAPVLRPALSSPGTKVEQLIGTLPQSHDFRIAAKDIAGDAANLSTQEKLLEAWTEKGIHPAEIAEDARHDASVARAIVSKDVDFPTAYLERRTGQNQFGPDIPELAFQYSRLRRELPEGYQAHHLNQNAVYGDVIPRDEGLSVALQGNAFTRPSTQHFIVHHSLEKFWEPYRRPGSNLASPTNAEYGEAHRLALIEAGVPEDVAHTLSKQAAAEREQHGLKETDAVPRIPGRLNQVRPRDSDAPENDRNP
jgi:hypothetical protein